MLPILYQDRNIILFSYSVFAFLAFSIILLSFEYCRLKNASSINCYFSFFILCTSAYLGAKFAYIFLVVLFNDGDILQKGNLFYGQVFFGSLLTLKYTLASSFFRKLIKAQRLNWLFDIVPVLPFAHALSRIGCFLHGCCYGSFTFFQFRIPSPLLESFSLVFIGITLFILNRKKMDAFDIYVLLYSISRFLIEFTRDDASRGKWGSFFLYPGVNFISAFHYYSF